MVTVGAGLAGTLAMARGDADWEKRLPMDTSAVFGSFCAVPLSLPAIVLFLEAMRRAVVAGLASETSIDLALVSSPVLFLMTNVLAAMLSWFASLLVLTQLAARSGAGWRVSPLIVGYNWSRLIVNLVAGLGAGVVVLLSLWPLLGLVALASLGTTIWLDYAILKRALDLTAGRVVGALAMVLLARVAASLIVDLVGRALL